MKSNSSIFLAFTAFLTFGFFACSSMPSSTPSLTINTAPTTLAVGDSIATTATEKKPSGYNGQISTNTNFTVYTLVSDDATVLGISGLKLKGIKAGTTTFSAHATDGSGLISGKYTITVTP